MKTNSETHLQYKKNHRENAILVLGRKIGIQTPLAATRVEFLYEVNVVQDTANQAPRMMFHKTIH